MFDPYAHAEGLGIPVEFDTFDNNDRGRWYPQDRVIVLRQGLPEWLERCTLTHELGHVEHGHPGGHLTKHERQAELWASRKLITWADIRGDFDELLLKEWFPFVANQLGVTERMLKTWLNEEMRHYRDFLSERTA